MSTAVRDRPRRPVLSAPHAGALAALPTAGVALAPYPVDIRLRLQLDPSHVSPCHFGEAFNCDKAQTSERRFGLG
jgi:hypothetical protein